MQHQCWMRWRVKQYRSERFLWWLLCGASCILAFSIFCDTSGVTNRINKCLIALKWNSSGFNRILITAYRCLLVTLNYHAFPLFALFFLFSVVCARVKWLVLCMAESHLLFLIHLIIFYIHLCFMPSKPCFMVGMIGKTLNVCFTQYFTLNYSTSNIM